MLKQALQNEWLPLIYKTDKIFRVRAVFPSYIAEFFNNMLLRLLLS